MKITISEMVTRISQLRLDHTEYTCLKALVLFKPEVLNLKQHLQVEVLQDQTHLMLQEYCLAKPVSANKVRFGRLLLVLPSINKFNKQKCMPSIKSKNPTPDKYPSYMNVYKVSQNLLNPYFI